jgi:hypothetical protein
MCTRFKCPKAWFVIIGVLFLSPLLTGCSTIRAYPKPVVDEKKELEFLKPYFLTDVVSNYFSRVSEQDRRDYRDQIVNARLRALDLQFEIFEKEINRDKNLSQIGIDWAVLGLSGAGAVVGGASTKAVLAAISGGLTGAKLSFDKNLFYEKTMPVLLAQMEASRTKQLANIRIGLQQATTNYSLTQALVDVDMYYKVGTLPGAIIAITSSAGAEHKEAQQELRSIRLEGGYSFDDAAVKIRNFWKPNGKDVDVGNEKKLTDWLAKPDNKKIGSINSLLYFKTDDYVQARKKAVADLGL